MADRVILPVRLPGPALLTPDNKHWFLYDRALLPGTKFVANGEPIIRATWNVYLNGRTLLYVKEDCHEDPYPYFRLHVYPADMRDLPPSRVEHGFDNRGGFDFRKGRGSRLDSLCMAVGFLPAYDISRIETGQYARESGWLWSGDFQMKPVP